MVMDHVVSLEYRVHLNTKLDYFDVIPDMEKSLRLRANLSNSGDYFTVVDWRAGQQRYSLSKYNKIEGFAVHYGWRSGSTKLDDDALKDFAPASTSLDADGNADEGGPELTNDEKRMLGYIYDKFRDQIVDEGWYLVQFVV